MSDYGIEVEILISKIKRVLSEEGRIRKALEVVGVRIAATRHMQNDAEHVLLQRIANDLARDLLSLEAELKKYIREACRGQEGCVEVE